MRPLLRTALLCAASVVLTSCGGSSPRAALPPSPTAAPGAASPFDAIIEQTYTGGWGVELAIYRNGAPIYVHGYGLRDRGRPDAFPPRPNFWGIPQSDVVLGMARGSFAPDANTVFDLASVSKQFTAGAILLLQQDGKLTVNDSVAQYFPNIPGGSGITLLELLQHRSGLVEYLNFGGYPDFGPAYGAFIAGGQTNYQPIVDLLGTFPLKFAPGTQYDYSNTNYLLLGMIVAKVSGMPLGTFLQQRVFAPLGMTQTQQGYPPAPGTDLALGYETDGSTVDRAWQYNLAFLAGCGGLTSTVGDLERWDRAVNAAGIFTQASLAQMFAPSPIVQPIGAYADGWFVATLQGHPFLWHDGEVAGFQTVNARFPADGIDIIILTNDGSGTDPYYILPQLFAATLSS